MPSALEREETLPVEVCDGFLRRFEEAPRADLTDVGSPVRRISIAWTARSDEPEDAEEGALNTAAVEAAEAVPWRTVETPQHHAAAPPCTPRASPQPEFAAYLCGRAVVPQAARLDPATDPRCRPNRLQPPPVASTGPLATAVLSSGAGAGAVVLLLRWVNPEAWWGALVLSAGGAAAAAAAVQLVSFVDGQRGVDRSRGPGGRTQQLLEYSGEGGTQFSPQCGLAAASLASGGAVWALRAAGPVFVWAQPAGKVYLTVAGAASFFGVLALLPTHAPDPVLYLPENRPSLLRRVLRYLYVPLHRPICAAAMSVVGAMYYWQLLQSHAAYDKVGTMDQKLDYSEVPGQPIGYARAEAVHYAADQVIARKRVNVRGGLKNMKAWLLRAPVPRRDVRAPTDAELWSICSKTVLAYNVADLGTRERCLDMTSMQFFHTVPGVHYNVAKVYLRTDAADPLKGEATRIVLTDGAVIRNDGDAGRWRLAKKHVVATANLFFPAMQHNWVHFHFVDNATAMAHNIFPRGSLLHHVVEPFVLGNLHTNENGLGGLVIGDRTDFLRVQQTISYCTNDFFVRSVKHRSLAFYTKASATNLSDDVPRGRVTFGFPPVFDENDTLPYTTCLKEAWRLFRAFAGVVSDVAKLDPTAYEQLLYWSSEVVRRTGDGLLGAHVPHEDVLATYMWQVSLLHTLDHQAYFTWMLPMNGFAGARCAYTAPGAEDNMYTADDVRIYRQFVQTAGLYTPGTPDDSLEGVAKRYEELIGADYPEQKHTVVAAYEQLKHGIEALLAKYINEPDMGVDLKAAHIASAILT
eukprot:TRINITY_DN3883_c1_g1_i1.p1 TRINITY_DN3883_c1_g1~~TRINITY_DN3883_c1_g1_i1.p1  ORF type:complete len:805 (+),score=316.65 TRINITY_DN3883_c1_g1_i1:52-2466(+)